MSKSFEALKKVKIRNFLQFVRDLLEKSKLSNYYYNYMILQPSATSYSTIIV